MSSNEQFANTAVKSWKMAVGRLNDVLAAADNDKLQREVAPGRNRITYLIGHLAAVNDRLLPMLGIGERLHPELDAAYIDNPDRALPDHVSPEALKQALAEVNDKLTAAFEKFTPDQWLEKHASVSAEDFAKDPSRNRMAVLLSRTSHVAMHAGQILLVK